VKGKDADRDKDRRGDRDRGRVDDKKDQGKGKEPRRPGKSEEQEDRTGLGRKELSLLNACMAASSAPQHNCVEPVAATTPAF